MKLTLTIGAYIGRLYFLNLLGMLFLLLGIIYLFDTVELIRRASKYDVDLTTILQMGLLKLPEVGQILFPFAVLFSAMFTFWQLNRRSELVVMRSAGFSVWQFLAPALLIACAVGLFQMMVVNPVGALLLGKYEHLEQEHLGRESEQIALFREGLWLRQTVDGSELEDLEQLEEGYVILHAQKILQPQWDLQDVSVFVFGPEDLSLMRIYADTARLEPGRWAFQNARIERKGRDLVQETALYLPTRLERSDIEESFSSPETMSFWQLPEHINTLEATGFDASRLYVHYHSLLAQPLFFVAMVLLAATVSLRPPRQRGAFILLASGIFVGFCVFFLSSYLQALGGTKELPPVLAAWSPALICSLLGLSVLMNLEDG